MIYVEAIALIHMPASNAPAVVTQEDLLTEEERAAADRAPEDCSKRRSACKNCSCGRAEIEAEQKKKKEEAGGDASVVHLVSC